MADFYLLSQTATGHKKISLVKFIRAACGKIKVKHTHQLHEYCACCDAITPTYRQECCVCGTYKD
jgi:hypothetical protein